MIRNIIIAVISTRPISNPFEVPLYVSIEIKFISSVLAVKNNNKNHKIFSTIGYFFARINPTGTPKNITRKNIIYLKSDIKTL